MMLISTYKKDKRLFFSSPYNADFIEGLRKLQTRKYEGGDENSISLYNNDDVNALKSLVSKCFKEDIKIDPSWISKHAGVAFISGGKVIIRTLDYNEKLNDALKWTFHNANFNWNNKAWEIYIASNTNIMDFHAFFSLFKLKTKPEFDAQFVKIAMLAMIQQGKRNDIVALSSAVKSSTTIDIKLPDPVLSLYPFQEIGVKFLRETNGNALIADQMGLGKAQPLTSKILTPRGWKNMGDMKIGMDIINSQGGTSKVTGVYPQGVKKIYKVIFTDGSSTECCDDHLWLVNTPNRRFRGCEGNIKTLKEISQSLCLFNDSRGFKSHRHYIPMVKPIEFYSEEVPIDPYVLGLMLGDGGLSDELVDIIEKSLPYGIHMIKSKQKYVWNISGKVLHRNTFTSEIEKLGLLGTQSDTKFIPPIYLWNSSNIRLSVLQGLLDTDGYVSKDNHVEYSSVSIELIEGVKFIVQSLGGTAKIHIKKTSWTYKGEKKFGTSFRLSISLPNGIKPFRLKRKAEIYHDKEKYQTTRAIDSVEYIGDKECQCIMTNAPDHLYITDDFIVTHNTITSLAYLYNEPTIIPILVVTLSIAKINWMKEIKKWTDYTDDDIYIIEGRGKVGKSLPPDKKVYVINYDIFYSWLDELRNTGFKVVVFDESHKIKNHKAKRTIAAISFAKNIDHVICLTGTPMLNRPIELWTTIQLLKKEAEFGNVSVFAFKYCSAFRDDQNHLIVTGASNQDELQVKLRTFMIRRTKQDVFKEFPSKNRIELDFELSNKKEYKEVQSNFKSWYKANKGKDVGEAEAMVKLEMLQQVSARGKVDDVVKQALNIIDNDGKVVIFAHHREVVESIYSDLLAAGVKVSKIIGGDNAKIKQTNIDTFNNTKNNAAIVCSITSAGTAINLQTCHDVIFVEMRWTPGENDQAEDRVHRIGQNEMVNVYYCISPGTVDQYIWKVLKDKRNVIDKSVDGMKADDRSKASFIKEVLDEMQKANV
jgi:hypothetical protein